MRHVTPHLLASSDSFDHSDCPTHKQAQDYVAQALMVASRHCPNNSNNIRENSWHAAAATPVVVVVVVVVAVAVAVAVAVVVAVAVAVAVVVVVVVVVVATATAVAATTTTESAEVVPVAGTTATTMPRQI